MVTIENHPFYGGRSMKDGVGFGAGEVTGDGTDFCRHSATRHRRVSFKGKVTHIHSGTPQEKEHRQCLTLSCAG